MLRIEYQVVEILQNRRDESIAHRADTEEACEKWIREEGCNPHLMSDVTYYVRKTFTTRR